MAALNRLLAAPVLLAFDFDGALAPICADPDDVRIRPSWVAHLQRINQRWPLAVISGRRLADLTPRLGFEPAFLAGNHGAESAATDTTHATSTCLDRARLLLASRFEAIHAMGIEVEDKGLSLAVHYRRSCHAALQRGACFLCGRRRERRASLCGVIAQLGDGAHRCPTLAHACTVQGRHPLPTGYAASNAC